MQKITFILFGLFFFAKSFAQGNIQHKLNLIIMVDEKIPFTGNITMHFIIENENKKIDTVNANYVPGDVFLQELDFNKIKAQDVKSISLDIGYTGLCKKNIKSYNYKIIFYKSWLQFDFTILKIYNFDKRKNRKIFFPLKGEEYTYEVDTPNGSMIKVRRKSNKESCD